MKCRLIPGLCVLLLIAGCGTETGNSPVTMRVAVGSSATPLMDDLLGAYDRVAPHVSFEITHGNAETLQGALAGGAVDWGLTTYLPPGSDLWSAPVGTDALIIVVHPQNPLHEITLGQLRAIYQGRVATWAESETSIVVVSREPGSAARGVFDEQVMSNLPTTPNARLATSSSAVIDIVAQQPDAIGYVSLAYLDSRVQALALDGVTSTPDSIVSGRYPLTSAVTFTALEQPTGPAEDLLTWLLSDDGQAVVAQRYTPLAR